MILMKIVATKYTYDNTYNNLADTFLIKLIKDTDVDDISDDEVLIYSNNPLNPDTNIDSLPDVWEAHYSTRSLLFNEPTSDLDNDSLTNHKEFILGRNPTNPDTDGDGLLDGWEVVHGKDPLRWDNYNLLFRCI